MNESNQIDLPEKENLGPNPSKAGVCFGMTKNLHNFESARVDAWCEDYCRPEDKKETMRVNSKLCWDHVHNAITHIDKFIEKKRILQQQQQQQGGIG